MNNEKSAIQVIAGAARCPEYSPSMVKALMKKLETNEHPCGMARRLMQIYESGPEIVSKIAGESCPEKGGRRTSETKEQTASCRK